MKSFSIGNSKAARRFRIHILLLNGQSFSKFTVTEKTNYSDNSIDWSFINIDFTESTYGIRLVYDQIDTSSADIRFSNFTLAHLHVDGCGTTILFFFSEQIN